MPAELELPPALKKGKWKVKIWENEIREPPHATIIRGTRKWRLDLATGEFMDDKPKPSDVPKSLLDHVKAKKNWKWLREQWNAKYPGNPVKVIENGDDDETEDGEGEAEG